uniref:DUF4939 domain-containing protein n=1 Tax=Esox lucius TaxID=8010 RepID=A0AAY5KLT4_ESOLU
MNMASALLLWEPPVTAPEPFAGELNKCRGFLLQCGLVYRQKPQSFATDSSKVHYALGLLRGRALVWAEAVYELAARDEPADLYSLVSLAIKIDNRLREETGER